MGFSKYTNTIFNWTELKEHQNYYSTQHSKQKLQPVAYFTITSGIHLLSSLNMVSEALWDSVWTMPMDMTALAAVP